MNFDELWITDFKINEGTYYFLSNTDQGSKDSLLDMVTEASECNKIGSPISPLFIRM